MPEFIQNKREPYKTSRVIIGDERLTVRFKSSEDFQEFIDRGAYYTHGDFLFKSRSDFALVADQQITKKTKSIWFPFKSHWGGIEYQYTSDVHESTRYPIYVVSKGRWNNGTTSRVLDVMGIEHNIVVEDDEFERYLNFRNKNANIIPLPKIYLDQYDTCDDLGSTKSKGPGAARNFCIDHSAWHGHKRHWVMDDNLEGFHYLTQNEKYMVKSTGTIRAAEDFVDRFTNVPVAGMNYYSFCKKDDALPPYVLNTRIYSCLLIDNTSGYRWRGRYNEDTDLSIRVLKDGLCTLQFNAFLCGKVTTQRMAGGNSKEFYNKEGTKPKSQMLADMHPHVAKVVWKFNRWHHLVHYKMFKDNELIPVDNTVYTGVNNYGLIKTLIK